MEPRQVPVVILTPLPVEYNAVRRRILSPEAPHDQVLPATVGTIGQHPVVCVLSGKGESNTAAAFQYACETWRPRWIILVGVAGGLSDLHRGDLIIANFVYYVDFGKLTEGRYIRRPEYDFSPDRSLLAHAELVAEDEDSWQREITVERPDGTAVVASRAHVGYVASGNKVVDDPDHPFFDAVRQTVPEIHAVEMEAAGAGAALRLEQARRAVGCLMVRGISDEPLLSHGHSGKEQRRAWKHYASDVAAAFVKALLQQLPVSGHSGTAHASSPATSGPEAVGAAEATQHKRLRPQYVRALVPLGIEKELWVMKRETKNVDGKEVPIIHSWLSRTALACVAEELLALGCFDIAVSHHEWRNISQHALPSILNGRIHRVDSRKTVSNPLQCFLEPVADELGVSPGARSLDFITPAYARFSEAQSPGLHDEAILALSNSFYSIYALLLGAKYRLQVDVDLTKTRDQLELLKDNARTLEARSRLASLLGIIASYEGAGLQSLQLRPSLPRPGIAELFDRLIHSDAFLQYSQHAYELGIASRVKRGIEGMCRLVEEVLKDGTIGRWFLPRRHLVQYTTKRIWDKDADRLMEEAAFIPPLVPLRGLMRRAVDHWASELPAGHDRVRFDAAATTHYFQNDQSFLCVEVSDDRRFVKLKSEPFRDVTEREYYQDVMKASLEGGRCTEHGKTVLKFEISSPDDYFDVKIWRCCDKGMIFPKRKESAAGTPEAAPSDEFAENSPAD